MTLSAPRPRGVFVIGTDTNVGKTQVACALLRALADAGERPFPFKPFESGVVRSRPRDAEALRLAARSKDPMSRICPYRFRAALAPGIAASHQGVKVDRKRVFDAFAAIARTGRPVVVEGAGGLLVPLVGGYTVADLAGDLGLPVLIVGRDGLGTINHTALTVEALRARVIRIAGIVLSRVSPDKDPSHADNAKAINALTGEHVLAVLPHIPSSKLRLTEHARIVKRFLAAIGVT
jgi:dethiobiotin synthetase